MEKKSNKKWIVIVLILIAALLAVAFFFTNKKDNGASEECDSCKVETENDTQEQEETKTVYSGETVTYNAYDFIIETMGKAQYWGAGEFPYYGYPETNELAWNYLSQTNGTGFKLYDEDTATFCRGYEGRLWINFSDNTAKNNPDNTPEMIEHDPDDEPYSLMVVDYFDFDKGTWVSNNDETNELIINGYVPSQEEYDENYYHKINTYMIIKETMDYYESIFEEVGCPLINQPAGTLASYKNKTIKVPVELLNKSFTNPGDSLIHAIWEQDGFDWNWATDEDNIWLDNMEDIFEMDFPETYEPEVETVKHIHEDESVTYETRDKYGALWLVRADPTAYSMYIDCTTLFIETYYRNSGGAIATYWLKPILKEIYGYDVVYFYEDLLSEQDYSTSLVGNAYIETKEDFLYNTHTNGDNICILYNKGDTIIGPTYSLSAHLGSYDFYSIAKYVEDICDHYGYTSSYGRDYMQNAYIYYDMYIQKELGLR